MPILEKCMEYFSQTCPDVLTFVPRFVLAIQFASGASRKIYDVLPAQQIWTAMTKCSKQTMTS